MDILRHVAETGLPERRCQCLTALDQAIVTDPGQISAKTRERLRVIAGDRLADR
jgi:hypothetical protein